MDLGTAAEGIALVSLASLMIAAWPFWILAFALALQAAIFRERRMAALALLVVAGIQVVWIATGSWVDLMNPFFSSFGDDGFSMWPVIHWAGIAAVAYGAMRGFQNRPVERWSSKGAKP